MKLIGRAYGRLVQPSQRRCPAHLGTGVQRIDEIENYWNQVRGDRLVPSRCEIDPRGLVDALGYVFILERIADGLARFRIAGSRLTEMTGLELRQVPISALFAYKSRETLSDALTSVFDEPSVARMNIASPTGFGGDHLAGEMVLLPLQSDFGDVDRVLGGMTFEEPFGHTLRQIEIISQDRRKITGCAGPAQATQIFPESTKRPVRVDLAQTFSTVGMSQSHLRLVISND